MLALRGISKAYGRGPKAIDDVTLQVRAGEPVLLVGKNGAGKSTLIRIATRFLDPDAGTVACTARIGYLPENAPAPAELRVRDHLRFRARLKGVRDAAAIDRALAAADIVDKAAATIGTLSKGYRQRVGLADALLGDPEVLVLDEPTGGMDPVQTRELCAKLVEAARERAVIVSSHAVGDLEAFAARVVVLRDGRIVADGTAAELRARTGAATLSEAVVELL